MLLIKKMSLLMKSSSNNVRIRRNSIKTIIVPKSVINYKFNFPKLNTFLL